MCLKKLLLIILISTYILSVSNIFAEQFDDEDIFFSYERFYPKAVVLEDPPKDGKIQAIVSAFMENFSDGIYAISAGDLDIAEKKLLKARSIWPEYFGTDFLLARINEDMGNYALAARFYKSYLNKLKSYTKGEYRFSGHLMQALTPYRIEDYRSAYLAIKERLKQRGIDLSKTRPIYAVPPIVRFIVLGLILFLLYMASAYMVIPKAMKEWRVKHPPEGFWVCKKCGTANNHLHKECEECGEPADLPSPT